METRDYRHLIAEARCLGYRPWGVDPNSPTSQRRTGRRYDYWREAGTGRRRAAWVEVCLPAREVSRPVYHRSVEEIWYILEGTGHVWRCSPDADVESVEPLAVSAGDALVIPTGWRFQFAAGPEAALRFLCHTTPPWPGEDEAVAAGTGGLGEATV